MRLPSFFCLASLLRFLCTLWLGIGVASCSRSMVPLRPDGVYRSNRVAFRVASPPANWKRLPLQEDALTFRDTAQGASILVSGRCGQKIDNVPLLALTSHLFLGLTERVVMQEETLPLDGREALHTRLQAKLDGVLFVYDVYVLKKDGCVYDLVYFAPAARFAKGLPGFSSFVRGFHPLS